jgi:hypothetical protein
VSWLPNLPENRLLQAGASSFRELKFSLLVNLLDKTLISPANGNQLLGENDPICKEDRFLYGFASFS